MEGTFNVCLLSQFLPEKSEYAVDSCLSGHMLPILVFSGSFTIQLLKDVYRISEPDFDPKEHVCVLYALMRCVWWYFL